MNEPTFIVAEISKTWPGPPPLLSKLFEDVIAVNLARGYILFKFALTSVSSPFAEREEPWRQETIIAVFRHCPYGVEC